MESKNLNEKDLSELTIRFLSEVNRIGISFYDIAKKTGVKESMFTKIKRGIQEPSKKFLNTFFECYPEANKIWLLTGENTNDIPMIFNSTDNHDNRLPDIKENIMNEVTKRFVETYKAMGLTGYKMGKSSNIITKQKISNIEQGITDASIDIISDFCSTYLTVSCDYILTGNGSMFKEEQETGYKQEVVSDHSKKLFEEFNKQTRILLAQRDEEIRNLQLENAFLKAQNNMQNVG